MATWNGPDGVLLQNKAAGTYKFNLRGGTYWVEFNGTGSGTVDLKRLGPDGATYTARITQITATVGQQTIALAPGQYEVVIATFTANYFEVTRIPTAVEQPMVAYNKFNAYVADLANKNINHGSDSQKVMLTNTAPVATNSQYSDISGTEVANGNGYTTGGTAASITSSTQTSGTYKLILGQVVFTATGAVGPFRYAVLYDSTPTTKTLIGWWDYGSAVTLANTDTFTVAFDGSAGVLTIA